VVRDRQPTIALVALGVAFPLYLNIHSGIRNADDQLIEATTASPHSVTPSPSGCGT
jgi:sulfonate transport system permease protein